jgi:membrane-associated phospholipid phosphatase
VEHTQRTEARLLVPAAMRSLAAAVLTVCAAVTALLGALFARQTQAGSFDAWADARIQAALAGQRRVLNDLSGLGDLRPVAAMTAALILVCLVTRRWRGAVLVAVAVPAAAGVTELVLKPLIGRTLTGDLSFPSGNETRVFALAAAFAVLLADPPRARIPAAVRLLLALAALLVAGTVGVAMVGLGHHYFTDAVGGAAVGVGMVLATTLILDRLVAVDGRSRPGHDRETVAPEGAGRSDGRLQARPGPASWPSSSSERPSRSTWSSHQPKSPQTMSPLPRQGAHLLRLRNVGSVKIGINSS